MAAIGVVASRHAAPAIILVWAGLFIAFGLFMTVGRFFVDAWVRSRTSYALTSERAIVLRRVFGESPLTAPLDRRMSMRQSKDGSGDLEFGAPPIPSFMRGGGGAWIPALDGSVRFLGVTNVSEVYRIAQGAAH